MQRRGDELRCQKQPGAGEATSALVMAAYREPASRTAQAMSASKIPPSWALG
jgi:hypothetical protein